MKRRKILGWHFLKDDGSFSIADGKPKFESSRSKLERVSTEKRPLQLCVWGLHACSDISMALNSACGALVRRVELSGEILDDGDKMCATERRELWRLDATAVLHEYACWRAEEALKREREEGRETDPRCWAAIEAKRKWLRGEISDTELRKAGEGAWEPYREGPCMAAGPALAARQATEVAACEAARGVGLAGDRRAQSRKLTAMLMKAKREALK